MTREYPFDRSGIRRGSDGIARYADRPASLVAALQASVDRWPEIEAVVEAGGLRLTYAQLWERAESVAAGLHDTGARPRDRVGIALPNGADWVVAFYGIALAGCIAVPINTRLTAPEVAYIAADADVVHIVEPNRLPRGTKAPVLPDLTPDDPAAIFYTSGTTGRPKGAITTHGNFLANTENARRVLGIAPPWRSLVSVPLFHVTGCNSQLLPSIEFGGTLVILPHFDPQEFLRTVVAERITALMSVPAVYRLVVRQSNVDEYDLGGVRSLTYGGAPMPPTLVGEVRKAFPQAMLGNGFGLTESASFCTYLPDTLVESHVDSVGLPAPVVDLQLLEQNADGVGELLVRGPNVVPGYWRNPVATAQAFVDGWLRTGDVARIGSDGVVQIVDRVKDIIIRGGENVYSAEVERALVAHPCVEEVAVVGVPDPVAGEKVAAAIVMAPGAETQVRAVLRTARTQLARYKLPELVAVSTAPLPRNPGGKVVKAQLRTEMNWTVAPR
jgi:acyl-CoA synthetase (AMP-forming)/AMP-acid ligase II